jgi:NTE family protein
MNLVETPAAAAASEPVKAVDQKVINLALQGGGSHGAFTWGVLDRLLEEERLSFEGISATSAGAVNAVVLADGMAAGGRQEARNALHRYWRKVADIASKSIFKPSPFDQTSKSYGLEHSPGYLFMESLTYYASPYQMNPFNINPLRDLLSEAIDFERVRQQQAVKLFLSATDVETAKVKIFEGKDLAVQHVLAAACLPLMMQAVEIEGRHYWDGSFTGNPALFPLLFNCDSPDILMVHITPAERPGVPTTSPSIMNRMQEISFNLSLIREMRTIAYLGGLIDAGRVEGVKRILIHLIEAEDLIRKLSWSSRLNGDWGFLTHLRELGRARAGKWLKANFDQVGVESTVDLYAKYF